VTSSAELPIPTAGLSALLRGWSGEGLLTGGLWQALAAVQADEPDHHLDDDESTQPQWTEHRIQARAQRVLLERLRPDLSGWPTRLGQWTDALPVVTVSRTTTARRPLRPTNWVATARRHGWPPQTFIGRLRTTTADELLISTLRWTIPQVLATARAAERLLHDVSGDIRSQLNVAGELLEYIGGAGDAPPPLPADLRAIAGSGHPWSGLAAVAGVYVRYGQRLDELAYDLIYPDETLRWRLFHLGVLGQVLLALREHGAQVQWVAPLSGTSAGPQYAVLLPDGRQMDLWFEAAGIWRHYNEPSPYRAAVAAVTAARSGGGQPIGADLLLIERGKTGLVLECKYSAHVGEVARKGYLQAVAYASELRSSLATHSWGYVVGPDTVVPGSSRTIAYAEQLSGEIGVVGPAGISELFERFLAVGVTPLPAPTLLTTDLPTQLP